ncbi:MAG: RNA-binding cell elongation regulator Jag/EloR [Aristaeellaceae bacterium]
MKTYEASAKTREEAIDAGLEALGVSISDVTVEVIDEGSKGLFGLFGSRLARVRLTVKETEDDPLADLLNDKPAPKPERKPAPAREERQPRPERKPEPPKPERKPEPPKPERKPDAPKADAAEAPKPEKKPESAETAEAPRPERKPRQPRQPKPEKKPDAEKQPEQEKKPLPPKAPAKPIEKPVVTMIPDGEVAADSAAGKAQAFLKELTHLMGVDVEVAVGLDEEGNVFVKMTGDTLGILIGRRGETLDALQYLTSLKVNRGQEGYTRVTLDTENYRAKREDTLVRLANRMANRAVKTGRKVSLEPMNPYERRIIHSALQANEAVDTHSEGDEPNRHVVITLRK